MQKVNITGEKRDLTGKGPNGTLRRTGRIPAVIYGGGENVSFSTTHKELKSIVYTPDFKLAEITIDGEVYNCILKDIQFHPVTDAIQHVDFLKLVENHPIRYKIPIRFKGTSPGVKAGGKLIQQMRTVKVKSLPTNMVDSLYADISTTQLGGSIRVRDLEITDKIEVESVAAMPVAIIEVPRALKSAQDGLAAAKGAVAAEVAPV